MLLNLRLQNCGQPLQGCVLVGVAEVDVEVAVPLPKLVPFSTVEVVEALEPTKSVLVEEDVVAVSRPVAFEVLVAVSVKRLPNSVDPVWVLIDA
jgi:hypothetical protein